MTKETVITLDEWDKESLRRGMIVMEDIVRNLSEDYIEDNFPIVPFKFYEVMEFFERIRDKGYF